MNRTSAPSDELIEETQRAVDSVGRYKISKGEKTMNATSDTFLAVSNSKHVGLAKDATSSVDFSVVKERVSNFAETSKFLMGVLDDVGKLHPFIQVAVVAFKAGIQLELTRRENDDRVLALNMTMCDMMSTLSLLKEISIPGQRHNGITIEERLHARMNNVVHSIRSCAQLCDSYQRRHAAVKFFTSIKWQNKFIGLSEEFVDHQNAIQSDLQLYIAFGIRTANSMLSTLNQSVADMVKMVFEQMQPAKDREIAIFVQRQGGQARDPNDQLLKDVIKHEQQLVSRKDEKKEGDLNAPEAQQTEMPTDLDKFKEEVEKDVDTILKENREIFEKRFDVLESHFKEIKQVVHRESDRVIQTILDSVSNGAQERIVDRGWKGSVKATYFVMALHEYFSAKSRNALVGLHAIANKHEQSSSTEEKANDTRTSAKEALPATPAKDLWSLRFITIHRVQPLIEALDDDGSSYITVKEVNAFTMSRPEGWSLPTWVAYWTVGFEMTTQWYYRRICRLLSLIAQSSKKVLPANHRVVSEYITAWPLAALQHLLSGLKNVEYWDSMDWENNFIFLKFKCWVAETEHRMEEILGKLAYYIDQDNTLDTVTGGGRPEKASSFTHKKTFNL
ncbi:hypothetical protein L218DRAFT_998910 [Marasmius fiardii PR-910]|nr:hypothetical protein L218DRAFT_998910 [Marasmius fiardii PR-910]